MSTVVTITTFFTGIVAGLFFAWTFSVMNGLAMLPDREFILAMQSMNRSIQNPVFFLFFFGALLLFPICAYMCYKSGGAGIQFGLVLVAMVLYIAVIGITMAGNVPLNNMLDVYSTNDASSESMAALRKAVEAPWNRLNTIRMVCNMGSFLLMVVAGTSR